MAISTVGLKVDLGTNSFPSQKINPVEFFLLKSIIMDLVEDKRYECFCGKEPYTNGYHCPKCEALIWLEKRNEERKSRAEKA